jgi:3-oxoadipate enol-lactonase
MDLSLAGGTLNAAVTGEGPPMVLLHSLLADRASFDRVEHRLAKHFLVIIPELPGFGRSLATPGDLPAVADRVAEAVREITLVEKPVVLGNGYGGFVALQMAIRQPDIVSRLILADCGAKFSEPGRAAFRAMAAASAKNGLEAIADIAMRRLFPPGFQAANPALISERRGAFLGTNPQVFQNACNALAELDLRADLEKVRVPVLVLAGEQDEATPPVMSRELAADLPDAQFVMLSGCAHVPQLQSPEAFLRAVEQFLGLSSLGPSEREL